MKYEGAIQRLMVKPKKKVKNPRMTQNSKNQI